MTHINHSSVVTSEALSVVSKLKKPETGFEKVELRFKKMDEKIKETVVDQFVRHANQLKELIIIGGSVPELDKANVADLAAAILEAQEEIHMERLCLHGISSNGPVDETLAKDKRLINAVVNSGITQLVRLNLNKNVKWFAHIEAQSYLIEFIKQ